MSDYHLVSTLHAHLLDIDLDCLGIILSHLGTGDALSTAHTCTTLRSALFRGGIPGPLASVCIRLGKSPPSEAATAASLRALDLMEPAICVRRLDIHLRSFNEGWARVLAGALDAAPRKDRVDITLPHYIVEDEAGRLAGILSAPDRAFSVPPQVHALMYDGDNAPALRLLAQAGVCLTSVKCGTGYFSTEEDFYPRALADVASTLTRLEAWPVGTFNLTTRFPALRKLVLAYLDLKNLNTDTPSFTALAPCLKEVTLDRRETLYQELPMHGFGFQPTLFARFLAAIQGVTCVCFGDGLRSALHQNKNNNIEQLTALRTLRDLEISSQSTFVGLEPQSSLPGPPRAPVAEDAVTNLPPLPPGLTRLAFSGATRVAFVHPLPELRVLDWRGSFNTVTCATFDTEFWDDVGEDEPPNTVERLHVPLAVPSAAIAPNLHTLLISFWPRDEYGDLDLWTLVTAPTALRVVVIERARLLCSAPAGFDTTTAAGFAAVLAREAKDMVSVHTHGCEIEGGHQLAVENFLRAIEERGGRVCRAGFKDCLFCMLHDGTDLGPRRW